MNNLNSIVDYLKVFNNIETYKKPEPRNMAHGGRIGFSKNPLKNFDRKTRSPHKGVTKIKKPITVGAQGNVKKLVYLDKATGKKITVYKAVVMDSPKKINYKGH